MPKRGRRRVDLGADSRGVCRLGATGGDERSTVTFAELLGVQRPPARPTRSRAATPWSELLPCRSCRLSMFGLRSLLGAALAADDEAAPAYGSGSVG
jgi:hypothetical protein